ncbi:MAG: hypothetical protein V1816_13065 [Pseudomonadota bacterium]
MEVAYPGQLGIVVQEQRDWPAAEKYYREELQIYIEFDDSRERSGISHFPLVAGSAQDCFRAGMDARPFIK